MRNDANAAPPRPSGAHGSTHTSAWLFALCAATVVVLCLLLAGCSYTRASYGEWHVSTMTILQKRVLRPAQLEVTSGSMMVRIFLNSETTSDPAIKAVEAAVRAAVRAADPLRIP